MEEGFGVSVGYLASIPHLWLWTRAFPRFLHHPGMRTSNALIGTPGFAKGSWGFRTIVITDSGRS